MKRVLYAWELGANLGHLAAFLPVAEALRDQGCEVVCAVRETQTAARVLAGSGIPWLQAPFLLETPLAQAPLNYTDIMLRYGFHDADTLFGHIGAWLSIFQMLRSEIVVADHAPAALLAAHFAGLPVMLFGTGFCCPPPARPLPGMRPWDTAPTDALLTAEARALSIICQVATRLGRRPPDCIGDLFTTAETAILGFPELDHYPRRSTQQQDVRYWGVIGSTSIGVPPIWPAPAGWSDKKLFAYLRPGHPQLPALLSTLSELGLPTVLYCPGLDESQAQLVKACPHLKLSAEPIQLDQAFAEADAAITHGSFATSTGFLQHGKPLLVMPNHLEQYLYGWRVEQNGLGHLLPPDRPVNDLLARLHRVVNDPVIRHNVEQFAAKYQAFDQKQVVANIAGRIANLTRPAVQNGKVDADGDTRR